LLLRPKPVTRRDRLYYTFCSPPSLPPVNGGKAVKAAAR